MNTQPEEVTISCPHCGQHLAIDKSMLDIELECPTCKQTFTASRPDNTITEEAIVADNASEEATAETAEAEKTEMVPPSTETVESAPSEAEGVSGAKKADDGMPEVSRKALFREKARDWLHKTKVALVSGWQRVKEIFLRLPERAQRAVMAAACASILILAGAFVAFSSRGVIIPLEEMAKEVAEFQSQAAPVVKGKILEFSQSLFIGKSDIPLEKQSRRIAFDFRSNGTTNAERGYTCINLFTLDAADAVFITLRDDGVYVNSRRNNADKAVKVSVSSSRWRHVEAVMKPDKVVVSIAGKKVVFPTMNGVRWEHFVFSVNKPNLQLRNVRSFPNKNHVEMAKLYFDGFFEAFQKNPSVSREGVQKLSKAAEGGLAEAQFIYAELADRFNMARLEKDEIFQWNLKAAKQGHIGAQSNVGLAYLFGEGVPKDHELAYTWLAKAAESRNRKALMLSGYILMYSDTLPHDFKKAQDFLGLAMLQEDEFEEKDKAFLYSLYADSLILPDDETKNVPRGLDYLWKAYQLGDKDAGERWLKIKNKGY